MTTLLERIIQEEAAETLSGESLCCGTLVSATEYRMAIETRGYSDPMEQNR